MGPALREALTEVGFRAEDPQAAEALIKDVLTISKIIASRGNGQIIQAHLTDWALGASNIHVEGAPHAVTTYFGGTTRVFEKSDLKIDKGRQFKLKTGHTEYPIPVNAALISDGDTAHIGPRVPSEYNKIEMGIFRFTFIVLGANRTETGLNHNA